MPIIDRFTRLLSADLNALIDRIEEPDMMLRQAARDLAHELDLLRQRGRELAHERARLGRDHDRVREKLVRLDQELDLCLAAGDEALARHIVKRKLESEAHAARIDAASVGLEHKAQEIEQACLCGEHELARLETALALAANAPVATGLAEPTWSAHDIDIALLREKHRRARR